MRAHLVRKPRATPDVRFCEVAGSLTLDATLGFSRVKASKNSGGMSSFDKSGALRPFTLARARVLVRAGPRITSGGESLSCVAYDFGAKRW